MLRAGELMANNSERISEIRIHGHVAYFFGVPVAFDEPWEKRF
jgi:hypothetical protein